ncbi:MAG TPA: prolyl oligopeptidase family serine peptidase [Dokdonella sp.]|uniref:S9 family peptidase n=1 Tax=Dokdonella sp. TaxID=2291710 RepID=UPI002D7F2C0E|nr:prolyl oligopeptidase family serine peptidase [Dokdonella sp.]HET9031884.1 prolyl oligopeptidase family serine peptidase [Dokdonella sp.]
MNLRILLIGVGVLIAILVTPITAIAVDNETTPRRMTIERLYSLPSIIGTAPQSPTWSPDSRRLAFLWNDQGMPFRDIWMTDSQGGKPVRITRMPRAEVPAQPGTDIAKLEQAAQVESDHGISELVWAPDGRHLIFALHGSLYQVLPGRPAQALIEGGVSGWDLGTSTSAKAIAYRSATDLWVADFKTGNVVPHKIFSPGRKDVRVESHVWSGDGKRLAFIEADLSKVPTRGIPDYLGEETRLIEVKRPFPGEPSPTRRLGVIAASGGEVTWMDLGDNPLDQIFDVRWSPDNQHLLVDKSDLYIKDRRLLILDPANGKSRLLLQETDPNNVTAEWWADWSPDGNGVYFISDRDNDYHVYYQALAGGEPKAITAGDWAVFSASILAPADALFVVSNQGNAESRRLYRVPLDGDKAQALTPAEGAHHPSISPDGKHIADLYSNDLTPPDLYLQSTVAAKAMRRQVTHSPLAEFSDYRWIAPKYVVFHNINDNTPVHARLTLPPDFDPAQKHPAILGSVYSNSVHNEWGGRVYHPTWGLDQILAQQGYLVMNVDISGSSGHGKKFRQRIGMDYGGVDVDDLYSATRYLIEEFQVDPKRIGIWGSSYGGLLTTMSMFRYPDAYAAGVAGAPASNVFHAMTGEMQTMMAPQDHAEEYAKSSPYLRSGDLKGHLMLIHGMRDWIVLYKDTLTLTERLILQGKSVDLVTLPNAPHGWDTEGLAQTRYAFRKLIDHFQRYLGKTETEVAP